MRPVHGDRCQAFVDETSEDALEHIRRWIETVGRYVAIRDRLAMSFALDYEREDGSPDRPQTRVGELRSRAKTYGGPATADSDAATDQLVRLCRDLLQKVTCYEIADYVIGMPPSDPNVSQPMATVLAGRLAKAWDRDDLSFAVRPRVSDQA